eukprot:m.179382 g.179382  ORF g.179382 m.179382 type:complete len:665 (-) comp25388_c0_seq1:140-2134(-)
MHARRIKCVSVGDGAVGKSALLITAVQGSFPRAYVPTVFENYVSDVTFQNENYEISWWDTAGQEDYDRLRPLSYPDTDVVLLCFSMDNEDSLDNVIEKWLPEVRHFIPSAALILVGCKNDRQQSRVPDDLLQRAIQAVRPAGFFLSTSAMQGENMSELPTTVLRAYLQNRQKKKAKSFWGRLFGKSDAFDQEITIPHHPPPLPKNENAPYINVAAGTFSTDMKKIYDSNNGSVALCLGDVSTVFRHCDPTVLCASSKYFRRVFGVDPCDEKSKRPEHLYDVDIMRTVDKLPTAIGVEGLNSGAVKGITSVMSTTSRPFDITTIVFDDLYSLPVLETILEFLYAGTVSISADLVEEVQSACRTFGLSELHTFCQNITDGLAKDLNPSITTYLNEITSENLLLLFGDFEDKPLYADVIFEVEGRRFSAHERLLAARCELFETMFNGQFADTESGTITVPDMHADVFSCLLEYFYCTKFPFEKCEGVPDSLETVLCVGSRFGNPRLVSSASFLLSKKVERACETNIERSQVSVVNLLLMAERHQADQLLAFCRHFIASNFIAFENRPDFQLLEGENKEYVHRKRWPPKSYLDEMAEYEKKVEEQEQKARKGKKKSSSAGPAKKAIMTEITNNNTLSSTNNLPQERGPVEPSVAPAPRKKLGIWRFFP